MTSDPGAEPKGYEHFWAKVVLLGKSGTFWAKAVSGNAHNSQHTPVIPTSCGSSYRLELVVEIEDQGPKLAELGALKRLGEEITDHVLGGAIFYRNLLFLDAVGDEEVAHIDVLCPLRTGELAVPLHHGVADVGGDGAKLVVARHGHVDGNGIGRVGALDDERGQALLVGRQHLQLLGGVDAGGGRAGRPTGRAGHVRRRARRHMLAGVLPAALVGPEAGDTVAAPEGVDERELVVADRVALLLDGTPEADGVRGRKKLLEVGPVLDPPPKVVVALSQ